MNLHDALKSSGRPRTKRKRVGRGPGSGMGKTSGRGSGGGGSRSGWKSRLTNEGGQMPLFRRLPKRGFSNARFREKYEVVNVAELSAFRAGSEVGPDELRAKRIARTKSPVKILGTGELGKKLKVRAHKFSKAAARKIEAAGGSVEVI